MSDDQLRAAALKRINQKRNFWRMLGGFGIVWIITIAGWALSGGGYFWPAWVIFGTGIAALTTGWSVYGPGSTGPSEQQIQDEMRRLRGQ